MHFYDYAHLILGPLSNSYCLESKLNAKALSKKIFDLDLQKKPMVSIELPNQFICDSLLFATVRSNFITHLVESFPCLYFSAQLTIKMHI